MNLLPFLPVTSQVCGLVSAPTEVSFLVFQKAVWPGGLEGLLGAERADRLVAGAVRQSFGVWDPWKQRGTESLKDGCRGGGTLESCGGHTSFWEKHPVPMLVKAGAELLAAALPHTAHACEQLGASGFVCAFLCHSLLCGCEVSQLERAFFQRNHNCAGLGLGWLLPSLLWKRANSQ